MLQPNNQEVLAFRRVLEDWYDQDSDIIEKYIEEFSKTGVVPRNVLKYFPDGLFTGTVFHEEDLYFSYYNQPDEDDN